MNPFFLITLIAGGLLGFGINYILSIFLSKKQGSSLLQDAEIKAKTLIESAEIKAKTFQATINEEKDRMREHRQQIKEQESKIKEQEEKLSQKEDRLEKKYEEIEKRKESLHTTELKLQSEIENIAKDRESLSQELQKVAHLSEDEAKELLLRETEIRHEKDILSLIEKKKKDYKNRDREIAREILVKAIQQYAGDVTAETTQTMITLASDDLKGKLIGREGRNIIAFERATGVSLIIDDAPDTVFLSSFDLFRRYIAKKSLEDLIEDKRIQPARIEEIVEKNQKEAEQLIYDLGRKTVEEIGVIGIPDEILPLIGKFRFRTSYGQNILMHSKEVAYIAEAIAKLIGADPVLALRGGLLHDIGKSMDHDIEGTHPEIGGRIGRKYGLDEKTINIIEGHHDDVPQICIETKIVQIADAISAVRPGARRMNIEDYIKRIQEMENIAMSFSGVNKAYALSAGREIRVFVDADTISDLASEKLAQEIATQIEANCNYAGEVRVLLIREKRVIEYAK